MRARSILAASAAAITIFGTATSARADNIQVDGDIVAAGQQSTLSLGTIGCNGTATAPVPVWLQRTGNGDNNNQNVFANSATVTIAASDSSSDLGVSLGQGSFTLPANWESLPYGNTQYFESTSTVAASAGSTGSHSATITYTASGAGAAGGTVTRSAQLTVNWTSTGCTQNQQPSVIVTGVADGSPYTFGAVPAAGCTVMDPENSTASALPAISPDNGDVGQHTATCTYTSASGLTATASATYTVTPATPSISLICEDAVYDGNAHPCSAAVLGVDKQPISGASAGITYSPDDTVDAGTVQATASYDGGGNYTGAKTSTSFVISKASSSVGVSCDPATYTGTALTPCSATVSGPGIVTGSATLQYSNNIDAGTASVTATYAGDNNHDGSSTTQQFTIAKAPTITTVSCPQSVYFTGAALQPCTASVSGPGGLSESVPVTYSANTAVGTATAAASYPGAANYLPSDSSATFQVLAWTMKGFFQPVDMNGVLNTVKAGSTVPLKFQIFSGATELTSVSAVKSFSTKAISCTTVSTALSDDVEITSTGGTSLRYDSTGDQFIQNWQTPKALGCYKATMTALDGSTISALFKLK